MRRNKILYTVIFYLIIFNYTQLHSQTTGCTIAGVIKDSLSGQFVIGVNVILYKDTAQSPFRGTITNRYGFYSLPDVPPGEYFFVVRSIGYKSIQQKIEITSSQKALRMDFKLSEQEVLLPEVVVKDKRESDIANQISVINISPEMIKNLPTMTGEVDLFRTLQLLPGIKISTEISNGLYVRGGSPDQTLTLVDGVIVYNPTHLGNFSSTFNTDAISDIKIIKGAFPANYGGRLSSVIDIKLREGSKDKFKSRFSLGMINSSIVMEGPLGENSTFMITGRRMYYDQLQNIIYQGSILPKYNFYDLSGKFTFNINESNLINISGFMGRDRIYAGSKSFVDYDIQWGNKTLNASWTTISSPTLFSVNSISFTNYSFEVFLKDKQGLQSNFFTSSDLKDFTFKRETEFFPSESNRIKFGAEVSLHNYKLVSSDFYIGKVERDLNANTDQVSLEGVLYVADEMGITDWFSANIGARGYYFKERRKLSLEPRIALSFIPYNELYVRLAYARSHQFLHMIVRNDISLPTDLWYPSNEKIPPARSDQFVVGFEKYLQGGIYQLSVEGYYKSMNDILEFNPSATFSLNSKIDDQLTSGKGEAYGIEFLLNKRVGELTGWIGYTLSWTRRKFEELNRGRIYYPRYDRRHDVSIVLTYTLDENWTISSSWVYGTGQAYTLPSGQYSLPDLGSNYNSIRFDYIGRNSYRLPAYHKLDLSIGYKFKLNNLDMDANLSFFNVYNRKNPFAQFITYELDPATNKSVPKLKQLTLFPFIPALSLTAKF